MKSRKYVRINKPRKSIRNKRKRKSKSLKARKNSKRRYNKRGGSQTTSAGAQCNSAVNNSNIFQSSFDIANNSNSNNVNNSDNYYYVNNDIYARM